MGVNQTGMCLLCSSIPDLPVTDRVAASLVRLPISPAFTDAECNDVVTACAKVFARLAADA